MANIICLSLDDETFKLHSKAKGNRSQIYGTALKEHFGMAVLNLEEVESKLYKIAEEEKAISTQKERLLAQQKQLLSEVADKVLSESQMAQKEEQEMKEAHADLNLAFSKILNRQASESELDLYLSKHKRGLFNNCEEFALSKKKSLDEIHNKKKKEVT